MKGLFRVLGVLEVIGVLGFVAFRVLIGGSTVSWNQRLTVIVDTLSGEVRGASITEITATETMGALVPMEARGARSKVRGEAAAVEVLPGKWLFALLSDDADAKGAANQLVYSAFRLGEARMPSDRTYEADMEDLLAQSLDTPALIPPNAYPLLVTFDGLTQPESVREVESINLAAIFGPGVALRGMTLEITEGRLRNILDWLDHDPGSRFLLGYGRVNSLPVRIASITPTLTCSPSVRRPILL